MLENIVLLGLALGGAVLLTGWLRRYAINHHLVAHPNERSSHTIPTPTGGGLAIVIPFLLAIAYMALADLIAFRAAMALFGGGVWVAALGYWDDQRDLPPLTRLAGHFMAAIWSVAWLGGVSALDLGLVIIQWGVIGDVVSVVGIVWLLNLYNFMDGIDGMAGSETIFVAGFGGLFLSLEGADSLAWVSWVLAAASIGFLAWNWPPAKIFMGDVGSGFLGFVLASLVIASGKETSSLLWSWLILLGVFIVDTTVTLARRVLRGQKWHHAHRSHAYQHAATIAGSHFRVTLGVIGLNAIWLLPWAWLVVFQSDLVLLALLVAFVPLLWLARSLGAGLTVTPVSPAGAARDARLTHSTRQ